MCLSEALVECDRLLEKPTHIGQAARALSRPVPERPLICFPRTEALRGRAIARLRSPSEIAGPRASTTTCEISSCTPRMSERSRSYRSAQMLLPASAAELFTRQACQQSLKPMLRDVGIGAEHICHGCSETAPTLSSVAKASGTHRRAEARAVRHRQRNPQSEAAPAPPTPTCRPFSEKNIAASRATSRSGERRPRQRQAISTAANCWLPTAT